MSINKLIIYRDRWLRGEGTDSYLLREKDNKMCCLGFYCKALGIDDTDITMMASPQSLVADTFDEIKSDFFADGLVDLLHQDKTSGMFEDNRICSELMTANDDLNRPEDVREADIIRLFSQIGVEVEFVDEPEGLDDNFDDPGQGGY